MLYLLLSLILTPAPQTANAAGSALEHAKELYQSGLYFQAARYAFSSTEEGAAPADAYAWITLSLTRAGMPQAASYFFIRTLQTGNKPAIRSVLSQTQSLMRVVGADLLRKYLIQHTKYEDYDELNRSAYLYALAKYALLQSDEKNAIGYLKAVSSSSPLQPYSYELLGVAQAISGQLESALFSFQNCIDTASRVGSQSSSQISKDWLNLEKSQAEDLKSRCQAGIGRTLYQGGRFEEADRAYDRIPKESMVWTDILFEQAWNSFARAEYNRTLGKLVTYKSPALSFVFNTEVDVLRAQTYLNLCLYNDANEVINEFNKKYAGVGEQIKQFVEKNANSLEVFYEEGKKTAQSSVYSRQDFYRLMNRFIRSPYFMTLVTSERAIQNEQRFLSQFESGGGGEGFPGFIRQVLQSRLRMNQLLGGAFVKNSLMDYHQVLIADFEKMSFIKLELLSRAKSKLLADNKTEERGRGQRVPHRRDDQYHWGFNGEFWNDELGDYVFGLESACQGT